MFRYLCGSKDSVVVDFDDPVQLEKVREVAAAADIVIETWTPGVAEARGLGADDLRPLNPALVVVSISAFGRAGRAAARICPSSFCRRCQDPPSTTAYRA